VDKRNVEINDRDIQSSGTLSMMKNSQYPFSEQLGDHTSLELNRSVLIENEVALANALKHNSTLKSLTVIPDRYISMERSVSSAIADVLRVQSALISLDLSSNLIGSEGAIYISESLKVNSTLTYLNLNWNSIEKEGAMAIADALKVNSSLGTLFLMGNCILKEGAMAIADALTANYSLTSLDLSWNGISA
jgi:Ran GTPase-activating protein (RanGAP) involved in mRNA processing and transport